jgi:hypothetical protein
MSILCIFGKKHKKSCKFLLTNTDKYVNNDYITHGNVCLYFHQEGKKNISEISRI